MIRMIFVVLLIAILKTPGASGQDELERGGTLPLRLRASGTLPLKLNGEATSGANSRIATQITITQATPESLTDAAGAAIHLGGRQFARRGGARHERLAAGRTEMLQDRHRTLQLCSI